MDSNDQQRPDGSSEPSKSHRNLDGGIETLIRFDELDERQLAELKTSPAAARAIALMESTEAFLESGGLSQPNVAAEELYAFGSGPGAGPLGMRRRKVVERHLSTSPAERGWVEGLKIAPPSPLVLDRTAHTDEEPEPQAEFQAEFQAESQAEFQAESQAEFQAESQAGPQAGPQISSVAVSPAAAAADASPAATPIGAGAAAARPGTGVNWFVWSPLAAAALVLAMALGGGARPSALTGALPDSPILRSGAQAGLLFPRGRVLAAEPTSGSAAGLNGKVAAAPGTFAASPRFEVTPSPGASLIRYELRLLDPDVSRDGLFGQGEPLWTVESKNTTIAADSLSQGAYEWTAWETINGIDRELGTKTFQVVADPDWTASMLRTSGVTEGVIRDRVRRLHAAGYLSDARNLVRALPESSERSSYLSGK